MKSLPAWIMCMGLTLAACQEQKISDEDIPQTPDAVMSDALSQPGTAIVDVRKPDDYASGHIPNAINIYLPEIREKDPRLADAKRIIVYANGPTDPLGIAGAKMLVRSGYSGVEEYKGGMERWRKEGRQVIGSLPEAEARPDTSR